MSWVKEANKIGRYDKTYFGYRVYCTKEPSHKESIVIRNGEQWQSTEFYPGHYIAINKHGHRLETKQGRMHMYGLLDIQHIKDYCSK